jgi:hypothetical protein
MAGYGRILSGFTTVARPDNPSFLLFQAQPHLKTLFLHKKSPLNCCFGGFYGF